MRTNGVSQSNVLFAHWAGSPRIAVLFATGRYPIYLVCGVDYKGALFATILPICPMSICGVMLTRGSVFLPEKILLLGHLHPP